jgi:hypothetical protein|tara:strand:- start:2895 stop:3164 length:270 start_codon:yes stop_codon:yes gene_type:complete
MKRSREPELFEPSKRQYFMHVDHKRKRTCTYEPNKRVRSDESDALHRMLVEAYARIAQLEHELKEAKFLQEHYLRSMDNPTYNHGIVCH